MTHKTDKWDELADVYTKRVYSLTSTREKRRHITEKITDGQKVLIIGCGSITSLQEEILFRYSNVSIIASDFSSKMLEAAQAKCDSDRLHYCLADSTDLSSRFEPESFDVVISTNSIIPENRKDVLKIYREVYRVLKPKGKLLAFLPSFEAVKEITHKYPETTTLLDTTDSRVCDTTGWQCFHTFTQITQETSSSGFQSCKIEPIPVESQMELDQLRTIYGEKIAQEIWEHFLIAEKSQPREKSTPSIVSVEKDFQFEGYESKNISQKLIKETSDYYRYVFNNTGHYLVCPSSFNFLSPQEVFNVSPKEKVGLEQMDSLTELPQDPITNEHYIFWHNPEITQYIINKKLRKNGHLTLIRDSKDRRILGFTFGYFSTAYDAFNEEGWKNPFHYAGIEVPNMQRSYENFEKQINSKVPDKFKVNKRTIIYVWNCVAKEKKTSGLKFLLELMRNHANLVSKDSKINDNILVVGEARIGSKAHDFFRTAGFIEVTNVLEFIGDSSVKLDSCLLILSFKKTLQAFNKNPEEFMQSLKV